MRVGAGNPRRIRSNLYFRETRAFAISPFNRSFAPVAHGGAAVVEVPIGVRRQIDFGSQDDWIQASLSSSRATFKFLSLAVGCRLTRALT